MNNVRIGNIELLTSGCNIKDNIIGEIVLWYPNRYYGKEKEYEWSNDGEYAINATSICRIHKSCFEHPESCFVIAFVEMDRDEEPNIRSVGSRVINLNEDNLKDYIKVCKLMFDEYNLRGNNEIQ